MPDSPVITVMDEFKAALQRQERAQMRTMARRWKQIEDALQPAIENLARTMQERRANGQPITQAALLRLNRYQALLAQLQTEWEAYRAYATDLITDRQIEYGNLGAAHATQAISTTGAAVTFNRLPVEAIDGMAGLLANGRPLNTLLMANATQAAAVDGLAAELLRGTALGWQPRKTARGMANKLAGGLNQALTIARSEQLRVYRWASQDQYRASGVVEGYYRLATRDDRVCPACLSRDGEFFTLDQEMPEHPNGRCAKVPKVVGQPAPQWNTGPQWFQSQDAATQRTILGPGRFDAYQAGEFEISDLARALFGGQFGPNLQTRSVSELAGG